MFFGVIGSSLFGQLTDDAVCDFAGVAGIDESFNDVRLVTRTDKFSKPRKGFRKLHAF